MGVLSDPNAFYTSPGSDWAQGDLIIAPTAILWSTGERPTHKYPQPAPVPPGIGSVVYDLWNEAPPFTKAATIECFLGPAMILTDDCALDKDFNVKVEELMEQGKSEADALAEARLDPTLDTLVLIAPILPYKELRSVSPTAVRTAQAIGYFPILESDEVDEGFVDFGRTVPVSRRLMSEPFAVLNKDIKNILRWKLAQHYAIRNLSVDAQIAAAVGKTIVASHTITDSKNRLIVELELEGGDCLRLRQEPRQPEANPSRVRGNRG